MLSEVPPPPYNVGKRLSCRCDFGIWKTFGRQSEAVCQKSMQQRIPLSEPQFPAYCFHFFPVDFPMQFVAGTCHVAKLAQADASSESMFQDVQVQQ